MWTQRKESQRGTVAVIAVLGLMALLGMAALTIDVGLLCIAAQQAQDVADAAALGAVQEVPDYTSSRTVALSLVDANNESSTGFQATCSSDNGDILFWGPHATIPDYGSLDSSTYGVRVSVHIPVDFIFAPVVGLTGTTVTRSSTSVRSRAGAAPIAPMWMSYEPPMDSLLDYGMEREMLMASDPSAAEIPGSFGWLEPLSGGQDFLELLRGYELTPDEVEANLVAEGDVVTAYSGFSVGQWRTALDYSHEGLSRLERATDPEGQWAGDTFDNFQSDNPRIILVPMVTYLGGTGSGAEFLINDFAAFWIESINSQIPPYSITGRFIKYQLPGTGTDALFETVWTVSMVQ